MELNVEWEKMLSTGTLNGGCSVYC